MNDMREMYKAHKILRRVVLNIDLIYLLALVACLAFLSVLALYGG